MSDSEDEKKELAKIEKELSKYSKSNLRSSGVTNGMTTF